LKKLVESVVELQTRLDAAGFPSMVIGLDSDYILNWLKQFEAALDDSTLVETYLSFRK
jgi:hypothetical protein